MLHGYDFKNFLILPNRINENGAKLLAGGLFCFLNKPIDKVADSDFKDDNAVVALVGETDYLKNEKGKRLTYLIQSPEDYEKFKKLKFHEEPKRFFRVPKDNALAVFEKIKAGITGIIPVSSPAKVPVGTATPQTESKRHTGSSAFVLSENAPIGQASTEDQGRTEAKTVLLPPTFRGSTFSMVGSLGGRSIADSSAFQQLNDGDNSTQRQASVVGAPVAGRDSASDPSPTDSNTMNKTTGSTGVPTANLARPKPYKGTIYGSNNGAEESLLRGVPDSNSNQEKGNCCSCIIS